MRNNNPMTKSMLMTVKCLPPEHRVVWDLIRWGSENAVSRPYLVEKTGMADRRIRAIIAELSRLGLPVGSSTKSRAGGYFKIATIADLEKDRHFKARALKQLQRDSTLEKIGAEMFGIKRSLFDEVKSAISDKVAN